MRTVNDKYTLWITRYSNSAYKDQFDKPQKGYIIEKEIVVTVIDVKTDVENMWTGERNCTGVLAIDENGEEYSCNYTIFPSDSISPSFYWTKEKGSVSCQIVDAIQAYYHMEKGGYVYIFNGTKPVLKGEHTDYCEKHKSYSYKRESKITLLGIGFDTLCRDCIMEQIKNW